MISIATAIAKATGLSKWLGNKLDGNNGGAVADQVIDIASKAVGGGTPEEILNAINSNEALRQELHIKLLEHTKDLESLHYADIANARALQIHALNQEDTFSKRFVYYFAIFWSIASITYVGSITFVNIPDSNVRFADTTLGFILGTLVATMFAYFFGSTRGSENKNTTIAELARKMSEK